MLQVHVSNAEQQLKLSHRAGKLQFGRIVRSEPDWITLIDDYVSREQLVLEEQDEGRLSVTNVSKRVPVVLSSGQTLSPGETLVEDLPLAMQVGGTTIRVEPEQAGSGAVMTILEPVRPLAAPRATRPLVDLSTVPDAATLISWFETIVAVQRAAAGSDEFYRQTARAVVELVGLDYGIVLLREQENWKVAAAYAGNSHVRTTFSRTILERVRTERRTFYQLPDLDASASLVDVVSVVASPVFDANTDEVVGAVYGARTSRRSGLGVEVRPLEAQLVQVLAAAVGAGLARVESEAQATRTHVLFEQFFSPELARALDRDPSLLAGRGRELSVMFADIRNFSQVSERIGARESCQLVESVMDRLTARVREFHGVLVTYLGDGLLAMWNAPVDQPDHAALACKAGLALISELPAINAEWEPRLNTPLKLGVGVNTGPAVVGNTGSRYKMHYGPLGHTVNLASRVEGATKQLGVPMLVTGATRRGLGDRFAARRICRVRVVGIAEPVDLFELHPDPVPETWRARRDAYESALAEYEAGRWPEACRIMQPLLADPSERDVPSLTLLGRCLDCLKNPPADFDPVWELRLK